MPRSFNSALWSRKLLRRIPVLACLYCIAAVSAAQTNPAPSLSLAVAVTDKAGHPVPGLTQKDFSVTDNRHPAPILDFHAVSNTNAAASTQVIFVIDEINLDFNGVAQARDELSRYLGSHSPLPIPASIILLGDQAERGSGSPTRDGAMLAQELHSASSGLRVIHRSGGIYGAVERLNLSLGAFRGFIAAEGNQPGRKLIVWISGGWPFLAEPGNTYDEQQQREQFGIVVDLTNELRKAKVTLDTIDPRGTQAAGTFQAWQYTAYLKGVRHASDVQIANLGLQVLAVRSGGLVLNGSNDVSAELAQCVREFESYYAITIPAAPATEKIDYHALRINLSQPGLTAHTTAGYYTEPGQP